MTPSESTSIRYKKRRTCLPPMTFESPLKSLLRLVTTISAKGSVSTLMKLPMVSSITIKKSYLSASVRSRERSAERKSGLEGNSVNRARMGGSCGFRACSASKIASNSSIDESRPSPKK